MAASPFYSPRQISSTRPIVSKEEVSFPRCETDAFLPSPFSASPLRLNAAGAEAVLKIERAAFARPSRGLRAAAAAAPPRASEEEESLLLYERRGEKRKAAKVGEGPLSFSFYILPERKKNVRRPSPMRYKKYAGCCRFSSSPPASFPPSHIPRGDKNRCLFLPSLLRLTSGFLFSERQEIPCLPRFDTFQKRKNSQR